MISLTFLLSRALAGSLTLGPGTIIVVTDVAGSDPSATDRGNLIGEVCAVGKTSLASAGDGWWRGTLVCANGVTYNTTAVAVAVPGTQPQPRSVSASSLAGQLGSSIKLDIEAATGSAKSPMPPAVVSASNVAPAAALRRQIHAGEPVHILALSPEDAYFSDRGGIIGKDCYPTDEMNMNDDGWHGGPVTCWDGESYYFYKVALSSDPNHPAQDFSGGNAPQMPSPFGGLIGEPVGDDGAAVAAPGALADGTKVVIKDLGSEDAFYDKRSKLLGKSCKVTGDLHPQSEGGWYGGGLTCNRDYYYFYQVKVEVK